MKLPYLLEMRFTRENDSWDLVRAVDSESLAIEMVKMIMSDLRNCTDFNNKFRYLS